ncbi:MAG: ATP-binding protein [Alcanivorax sp.]|uniref:ATP-binding protein n=1 Tax=Alloalcanivorax marinus TaxID=1177169 RepID=UPI0019587542|nr:ATP-binding protein [Alloalcanivorax marinus]
MSPEQRLHALLDGDGESEIVEFKEARQTFDFKKLGRYFSALSNEANLKGKNSAWLIFGVRDDHQVVGTRFRYNPRDLQSLKKEVADKTINRHTFSEIYCVDHPSGRVLLMEIPAAPRGIPISWEGHYFGRDGASLGPLSLDEIERIRNQDRIHDWSAEICEGAMMDDLDPEAILLARREFATKNPKLADQINAWDDPTFLNKAKITIQGKITRTAILLLGKQEASHYLNPATPTITWILKDRDGIEKDY